QVVAAVIGAAFVIGLQVAAILSYGTLSRTSIIESQSVMAHAPGLESILWWPARAALGEGSPLAAVLLISFVLLAAVILLVAPRFGEYAITAAGAVTSSAARTRKSAAFRSASPRGALRHKEW